MESSPKTRSGPSPGIEVAGEAESDDRRAQTNAIYAIAAKPSRIARKQYRCIFQVQPSSAAMQQSSKHPPNQNRERSRPAEDSIQEGNLLIVVGATLSLWPVANAPGSDLVASRLTFKPNCISYQENNNETVSRENAMLRQSRFADFVKKTAPIACREISKSLLPCSMNLIIRATPAREPVKLSVGSEVSSSKFQVSNWDGF